ncbi:MAG: ATP-binding protein [Verrucomicrobiota bacterium]
MAALEAKVRENDEGTSDRFRLVVESAPNGIIVANDTGRIVMVNERAEELFGYDREEFLTKGIEDLVPTGIRGGHGVNRERFHADPRVRQMGSGRDLLACRKDGSEFPVEIGLTPLPYDGETLVLSSVVDITERKESEEELRRYARELERSNAELESFASVASHDLQEPLRKIRTMGGRLKETASGELGEKGRGYVDRMIGASERMHQLLLDLLAYSRVATQGIPFHEVNLSRPVQEVLSLLEIAVEASGGEVMVGELPSAEVDESQMRQLFQNLIGNALKFARKGVPIHVEVGGEMIGEEVFIRVKDNGIGFEETYRDRIFAIFQRLHGRHEYEGTGVGLAICKKIVERHGGEISAKSQVGEGSEFEIKLPRRQGARQPG